MKHYFLIVATILISQFGFAQETTPKTESETQDSLYAATGLESKPEYKGGLGEFYKFISNHYQVPTDKKFKGGKVFVSFVIEKDGSVTDIKVLRDCGFRTGDEAKRVLSLCPKWIPGEQNGKKVRVQYAIPINLPSN